MRYSYATVALPALTPEQACAALSEAGFAGVEWKVGDAPYARSTNAPSFLTGNLCTLDQTVEAAHTARQIADRAGLAIVGLGPYIQTGDIQGWRTALQMAVVAGAPQIRIQGPRFFTRGDTYRTLFDGFSDFLFAAVSEASERGIRTVIELHHKTIVPSVGLAMPLLRPFDPSDLGVIYDVGNMVYEGYEDERIGIELLGDYLHHVHLKNVAARRDESGRWSYEWARLNDGLVNVPLVLELLADSGYKGWVSIEDLSFEDSVDAINFNASVLSEISAPGWSRSPASGRYPGAN